MSSPHVAGAAALLWSAAPDLIGDIDLTEQVLIKSATPVLDNQCLSGSAPCRPTRPTAMAVWTRCRGDDGAHAVGSGCHGR